MELIGTTALVAGELSRLSSLDGSFNDREKLVEYGRGDILFQLVRSVLRAQARVTQRSESWEDYVRIMKQPVPDACAIMACAMALEGMHCVVYKKNHGEGALPVACKAAESWPEILREVCEGQGIWKKDEGANVDAVLDNIKDLEGMSFANKTTGTKCSIPLLRKWKKHSGDGLTPQILAAQLEKGPCVGRFWACSWYFLFKATNEEEDDACRAYRGCGREEVRRNEFKKHFPKLVLGSHAVVCVGYRFCGNDMHVLVLDNHDDNGPRRWIHFEELDAIFSLRVDCQCGSAHHRYDEGVSGHF